VAEAEAKACTLTAAAGTADAEAEAAERRSRCIGHAQSFTAQAQAADRRVADRAAEYAVTSERVVTPSSPTSGASARTPRRR
jgi:hypothetical protein